MWHEFTRISVERQVCDRAKRPCLSWDVADGFQAITNWSGSMPSARDPLSALEQVDKADGDGVETAIRQKTTLDV